MRTNSRSTEQCESLRARTLGLPRSSFRPPRLRSIVQNEDERLARFGAVGFQSHRFVAGNESCFTCMNYECFVRCPQTLCAAEQVPSLRTRVSVDRSAGHGWRLDAFHVASEIFFSERNWEWTNYRSSLSADRLPFSRSNLEEPNFPERLNHSSR